MGDQLHLASGGRHRGAHDETTIRQWHRAGQLAPDAVVWREGMVDWKPVGVVLDGQAPASVEAPPPPPPPEAIPSPGPAASVSWPGMAPPRRAPAVADLAGPGRRFGGVMIDGALFWVMFLLLGGVVNALDGPLATEDAEAIGGGLVLLWIGVLVVWQLLGLGRLGQTYGKHLAGVRVVRSRDGGPIDGGTAVARSILQTLGLYVLGLGWLWAIWDDRNQGWHDKAVSSVVVDASGTRKRTPFAHVGAAFRGHW